MSREFAVIDPKRLAPDTTPELIWRGEAESPNHAAAQALHKDVSVIHDSRGGRSVLDGAVEVWRAEPVEAQTVAEIRTRYFFCGVYFATA